MHPSLIIFLDEGLSDDVIGLLRPQRSWDWPPSACDDFHISWLSGTIYESVSKITLPSFIVFKLPSADTVQTRAGSEH